MSEESLEILYRDEFLIAVNKPPGIFVHRSSMSSASEPNVVRRLRRQIDQLVTPVHRLDRATSGVLLFALDTDTARKMSRCYSERAVVKKYMALVRGYTDDRQTVDYPLKRYRDGLTTGQASGANGQQAITEIRTMCRCEVPYSAGRYPTSRYSLIEAVPLTGRRHQIRRHLKQIAHPVIGDVRHGDNQHNHLLKKLCGLDRMMLAACYLEFQHPVTGCRTAINAPLRPDFQSPLKFLGLMAESTRAEGVPGAAREP